MESLFQVQDGVLLSTAADLIPPLQKELRLPEGITAIGEGALQHVFCDTIIAGGVQRDPKQSVFDV